MQPPQTRLRALFDIAVAQADPARALPPFLAQIPDPRPKGRLIVLGAGKAAAPMAQAVRAHFGPCEGLVITRYGHQGVDEDTRPEVVQAGHPVPDQAGAQASARMLSLVQGLTAKDLVLVLISGGASALLCAPRAPVTLREKIALTDKLLAAGAPIGEINLIRKQFSRVKGGQLAAACAPARVVGLIVSDVAGDDLADIGSGPTVGDGRDARGVAARWGVELPPTAGVLHPSDPRLARTQNHLIAAPMASLQAAAQAGARDYGWQVQILGDDLHGEARDLAQRHAEMALQIAQSLRAQDQPQLLLSGGEVTVTLGAKTRGRGGPNAEYALALALALRNHPRIYALAADTDGIDGAGAAAGAVFGPDLPLDARAQSDLDTHNAHGFFARCGGAVMTGPTRTNVNDFRAILILPPLSPN